MSQNQPPRRSLLALVALSAVLALLVAACGSDSSSSKSSSSSGSKKTYKMTLIAGVKGDEFYITMNCGAQAEAKKLGVKLDFQGPDEFDASQQTPIVNAVAAKKPDAVLIAPTDTKALYAPIKQMADAGTKIVLVDTTLDQPDMAVSPPLRLSEAICETPMLGSSSVVSTKTTFEPLSASCLIGAYSALVSVGAISTASGFFAATALTIGVCRDASNWSGPWKSRVAPAALAAAMAPQFIVM